MDADEILQYFHGIAHDLLKLDTASVLDVLVHAAVEVVDGCDHAAISYLDSNELLTAASNNATGPILDRLQTECDEGPCMDAARLGGRHRTDDLRTDQRWPHYGPRAAELGVLSACATSLHDSKRNVGALNLFADRPGAFASGMGQDALVAVLAPFCGAVLIASTDRANLERALLTRDLIGQAKGMLMNQSNIDSETAFAVLRSASQRMNVKLAQVAQRVVDGTLGSAGD